MATLYAKRAMHESWETPAHIFEPLDEEFGFTLDAAASADNRKCPHYFSVDEDGLACEWGRHVVWLNPPYGDANLRRWIKKAYDSAQAGATVVCFVPVNASSVWWTEYAPKASEIRWVRGRVRFVGAASTAPFASCLLIFRPPMPALRANPGTR